MALHVLTGSGAPATAPEFIGQHYVDTANAKQYLANGTAAAGDWQEVGSGGGGGMPLIADSLDGKQIDVPALTGRVRLRPLVLPGTTQNNAGAISEAGGIRVMDMDGNESLYDPATQTVSYTAASTAFNANSFGVLNGEQVVVDKGAEVVKTRANAGAAWADSAAFTGMISLLSHVSIAYGAGKYVLVGNDVNLNPGGYAIYSTDLTSWTGTSAGGNQLNDIIWTGSQFVAVGGFGSITTSPDGVTWTDRLNTGQGSDSFQHVIQLGSALIAAGYIVRVSTDSGVTWTTPTLPITVDSSHRVVALAVHSGTAYALVCDQSAPVDEEVGTLLSSTDGVTWTQVTDHPFLNMSSDGWTALSHSGSLYFIDTSRVITRLDGSTLVDVAGTATVLLPIDIDDTKIGVLDILIPAPVSLIDLSSMGSVLRISPDPPGGGTLQVQSVPDFPASNWAIENRYQIWTEDGGRNWRGLHIARE